MEGSSRKRRPVRGLPKRRQRVVFRRSACRLGPGLFNSPRREQPVHRTKCRACPIKVQVEGRQLAKVENPPPVYRIGLLLNEAAVRCRKRFGTIRVWERSGNDSLFSRDRRTANAGRGHPGLPCQPVRCAVVTDNQAVVAGARRSWCPGYQRLPCYRSGHWALPR